MREASPQSTPTGAALPAGRLSRARRLIGGRLGRGPGAPFPRRAPCRRRRHPVRTRRARVPPARLEGTERDTRQPEDTTAPRKSAAAACGPRSPTAGRRGIAGASPNRSGATRPIMRGTPRQPNERNAEPSALDTIAASVASLFTSPASDSSRGQSYDQYMQTHEIPKRAPLMDYETTASTEERGPVLGRDGYDPGQRVVPALDDACGCSKAPSAIRRTFSPAKPRSPRLS